MSSSRRCAADGEASSISAQAGERVSAGRAHRSCRRSEHPRQHIENARARPKLTSADCTPA